MRPLSEPRPGRDRGAVLPIALILSIVLGVVVVAVLGFTFTALRTSNITDDRVDRLAAAESGLREALVHLDATGTCPGPGVVTSSRNGTAVSLTDCRTFEETSEAEVGRYGLVITGIDLVSTTEAFTREQPSNLTTRIGGPIFVGRGLESRGSANNVLADDRVEVQRDTCPTASVEMPRWLQNTNDALCRTYDWRTPAPFPTGLIRPAGPATIDTSTACRVVSPGTIGTTTVDGPAYFRSGTYVVTGPLTLTGTVVSGHGGGVSAGIAGECVNAQAEDVADGGPAGAVFVFEGSGRLDVAGNRGSAEFFGLDVDGRPLSVVAFPTAASGFSSSSVNPNAQPLLRTSNPNGAFSFFGEVWVPGGWLETGVMAAASGAALQGGATVSRLSFKATNASTSGLIISLDAGPATSVYRLEATATSPSGATTTASAVARGREGTALLVETWRVG